MKDKTFCKLLVVSIGLAIVASGVAVGASTMDKASNGSDYNGSDSNVVKVEATGDWLDLYHPPTASISYIQWSPLIITFDASSSSDPDGTVERYKWDFGDGNTATGMIVSHTYSSAGKYNVTLTATDNNFLTDTKAYNITVLHYLPVHNIDTGESFSTIQLAVDDPDTKDRHTIIADPGTYEENIKVDKRLRIQSESGADLTIVQAAKPDDHVFDVRAAYVTISGFTVKGAGNGKAGIYLGAVNYCEIANNNASNNWCGIYLEDSSNNMISNNEVNSNSRYGICLWSSSKNRITSNNIKLNHWYGIYLVSSSSNNIYFNNFIDNNDNVRSHGAIDIWNSTEKIAYRCKGGSNENYLGNYWSDYIGEDTNKDGIGDTPYSINSDKDNYPLMVPWENYFAQISRTIYVPDVYPTIQAAVNAASAGDTIIVRDGYYIENVDVNKRLTIRSENGPGLTIIRTEDNAPHTDDHVFDVTVDYVNISGFGVEGSYDNAGIHLYYADYCNISNNICSNNAFGISIDYSNNSSIINNDCTNNDAGIALFESNNNSISNNFCSSNTRYFGIGLLCSNNNSISKNICYSNKWVNGIYLGYSKNNIISNNSCSSNSVGIYFEKSNNNIISNNNFSLKEGYNRGGISLRDSNNNIISDNTCSNNTGDGIYLGNSNNNRISNNTCSNNNVGISLQDSNSNKLRSNILVKNGIAIGGKSVRDFTHEIDMSNTVNGKPVYYWKDVDGGRVHDGAGQVILVNCRNVVVENQKVVRMDVVFSSHITIINNEGTDIYLENANNNRIFNNTQADINLESANNNSISNNTLAGICLRNSNDNRIFNNICSNNWYGILARYSNNNSITNNHCSSNDGYGIGLLVSDDNGICNNTCSNNGGTGIILKNSNNNRIFDNNCSNNRGAGIYSWYSNNNKLKGNVMVENGIFIEGETTSDYTNEINMSNLVNGKPVYYWKDVDRGRVPEGAGQVILVNCKNVIVENQNINNASVGIAVVFSSYITIKNNTCSNNKVYGVYLLDSNSNNIFLNNFINNTNNVHYSGLANAWNSTEEITYTYNETTYTEYLGNYWGDYEGSDVDGDGIGDTPYRINSDKDIYPLMQPWENYFLEENGTNTKSETSQFTFSSYYQPIDISVNLSVPAYQLPLNLSTISNIEDITKLRLNKQEEELLETNGFVILDYGQEDDIVAPYKDMKDRGIPIFVTSDTLLHLYHIQFNEILKGIEEREFFDALVDMSNAMLNQSVKDYENFSDPELKESARRNVAYFAVALKLLQTPTEGYNGSEDIKMIDFSIPDYVIEDVNNEIANITQHDGFHPSAIFNSNPNCICDYPCCYCEDYSQYVPRGHYTRSEQLKRYFNAMMWYGRIAFMLKGCSGDVALISEQDANRSTIQAALISSELPDVTVNNSTAQEIWYRIYSVTAFFVGTADDLTPYEYRDAQNIVFGTAYNASDLSDENRLLELKVELAKQRSPEIYGGSGVCVVYPPITEAKLYVCLNETKGMRFMGQRFVPDSYMFQQLVSPAVGMYTGNGTPFTMCYTQAGPARCFPRGLDIMSVLGSERAEDILIEEGDTEYAGLNLNTSYEKQLNELKLEFTGFNSADWNRNLYWSWLYTLKPLLTEFGDGYPTFMQTKAWQNKALQTALASWTELRHDTILYAKQSYTPVLKGMPPEPKPVVGYVEPLPEFYARLLALTEMTENGLVDLDVLNETEKGRLHNLEGILERLMNISVAELENETLTENDYKFIRGFGEYLDYVVAGVNAKGKETTIVADVHTDDNTGMVLEEGVGYVDLILVAYIVPDGRIIVGAGPVFSYYEFKRPMDDRLTDEKWTEMLKDDPPKKPGWVDGIGG